MGTIQDSFQSSQGWTSQQVHLKVTESAKAASQTLQASASMLNVKVHDSTIRKRLNMYDFFGTNARGKPLGSTDVQSYI